MDSLMPSTSIAQSCKRDKLQRTLPNLDYFFDHSIETLGRGWILSVEVKECTTATP